MNSIRLDRLLTLGVAAPYLAIHRRFQSAETRAAASSRLLPILMYHSISDMPEPAVAPYYRTVTTPRRFAEQMRWMNDNGYQGVSLSAGLAWLTNSQPSTLNYRPVSLTFDDGFQDFCTAAVPVLKELGFTATMFLSTAFIGETRRRFKPSTLNSRPSTAHDCLTWSEVHELHAAGIEFGSHTVSHPKLVDLDWPEIEVEISNSKSEIEHQLSCAVGNFAYPYAFPRANTPFVARFREVLCRAGYSTCVTTEIGRAVAGSDPFRLKRLPVNNSDDLGLLRAKLDGAYDWLAWPQIARKAMKATFDASGREAS